MKRIIVTGATGFIGARFVRAARGSYGICALAREGTDVSGLEGLEGVSVRRADGRTDRIIEIFGEQCPDAVLHIASKFCAQHSSADIEDLVGSNILFGTQILEAMRVCGCSRLLNIGSSWQHYQNEDYNPVNLYSATKQAFKDIVRFYEEAYGLKALNLELFDTYGPGDKRRKLLNLLKEASEGSLHLDMSPGDQLIDLLHVDDVVSGLLVGLERLFLVSRSETFVLSSSERMSLRDLVERCRSAAGAALSVSFGTRPYREREVMEPWSRGLPLPGWAPRISLDDGLRDFFVSVTKP